MGLPAEQNPMIDVCHACGKLFPRLYVQLCSGCVAVDENRFQLVRGFLADNHGASIPEIADATGLSRGDIARFYAEGRLVEAAIGPDGMQQYCTCSVEGKRCNFCRRKLARQLDDLSGEMKSEQRAAEEAAQQRGGRGPRPLRPVSGNGGSKKVQSSNDNRVQYVRRVRRQDGDGGTNS